VIKTEKTFAVHQPNFIPWIGYFDKISKSDIFIILDEVQYPRGKSIANRNKICNRNGEILEIVAPVSIPKGFDSKVPYENVLLANKLWYKKALKTIEYSYKRADYFDEVFELVSVPLKNDGFCEMNISFIRNVCEYLNFKTNIILQSELGDIGGNKSSLIAALGMHMGASTYLSGKGAMVYNDEELYQKKGIKLTYQEFNHPIYNQHCPNFLPNLSIIDLLFFYGHEAKLFFQ